MYDKIIEKMENIKKDFTIDILIELNNIYCEIMRTYTKGFLTYNEYIKLIKYNNELKKEYC